MRYDIFNRKAPAMPKPSRGTEFCKLLLSQVSKDMQEPLVPMAIPALAAHLTNVKFLYSDNKYYELCGQMGHLIGPSGVGKAQLSHLIEAFCRDFRLHDEVELQKLVSWQKTVKTKGANKEKLGGGNVTCHVNAPVSLSQYAPIAGAHGGAPLQLR